MAHVFCYRLQDWYEWIHVTGFWFLDNPGDATGKTWTPPKDLVDFIASAKQAGRKLVYIGWGSIVVPDAAAMDECVAEAVQQSGVHAIVSRGWSDRFSDTKDTALSSSAIFRVDSVPHDWLFPQLDAACHHGGAGTLGASLRAGLPTIVKPYFGDQFFWGQQVESLGVGTCVRNCTVANLAQALRTATQDQRQIERARQLGERIRAENGMRNAVNTLYRELDYARTLIKTDSRLPSTATTTAASHHPPATRELEERPGRSPVPVLSSVSRPQAQRSVSEDSNWSVV
jgi:sterol 3beta-glucosyltransferase